MASKGVAVVLEENNLGANVVLNEIRKILDDKETYLRMSKAGQQFNNSRTAAEVIARELIRIGLSHT
jgi:UDP-N-acetylglucosamine:LPS N-acetylglucosamine transferase